MIPCYEAEEPGMILASVEIEKDETKKKNTFSENISISIFKFHCFYYLIDDVNIF